jgi:hypothetical protein
MVFFAWNDKLKHMPARGWTFTGIAPGSIALARPKANEILFMFKDEKGNMTFGNDFRTKAGIGLWTT